MSPTGSRRGRLLAISAALAAFTPAKIFACAACGSANANMDHSSMVDGVNVAILTLGAILLPVLGAFLAFLIYAIRKSEAVEAAAAKANQPQSSATKSSEHGNDFSLSPWGERAGVRGKLSPSVS